MISSRVMIAATSSGSGKTTITCGLLQALVNRKLNVASFKCGPDYIDPMFHSKVIGTKSKNLDSFFNNDNTLKYLMGNSIENMDISVIEGVMGYYDGLGITSTKASSYDVSQITHTPVILVVNCKGMSLSIIPVIKGFMEYQKDSNIKGVILNRTSSVVYKEIKNKIEDQLNIQVFGYVPDLKEATFESRHLGLVTPNEVDDLKEKINKVASILEDSLDIDGIIDLADSAPQMEYKEPYVNKIEGNVKIGVAYDDAFCFYYEDNMQLLKRMGAEIVYFSPLNDKNIPKGIDGLIFGGGYPELYAKALSDNKSMIKDLKNKINAGMPVLAECGGFMYLHEELEDDKGNVYKEAGIIKGKSYNTKKLGRFGYIELEALEDNFLCKKGTKTLGHEFHYWDSTSCGDKFLAKKTIRKKSWKCINISDNVFAGYPHLNYYSNMELPYNFLIKCLNNKA